jgi:hypothetical protein
MFNSTAPYAATNLSSFNTGSTTINGSWVKITLNEEKKFNYFRLGQESDVGANPVEFTIYCSNDNITYTAVNQQNNYNNSGTNGTWMPKILLGNQQYKYIVLLITKISGAALAVSIRNMEIGYE